MAIFLQLGILIKVFLAMALGAVIGLDRERSNKPAGLRTHIFVAGSSALFVSMAAPLAEHFRLDVLENMIQTDPIRIIEAMITGVAFLGAGTIIKGQDDNVYGLTTAASLLLTAAIGMAIAIDLYLLAVGVTGLGFVVLRILGFWGKSISES